MLAGACAGSGFFAAEGGEGGSLAPLDDEPEAGLDFAGPGPLEPPELSPPDEGFLGDGAGAGPPPLDPPGPPPGSIGTWPPLDGVDTAIGRTQVATSELPLVRANTSSAAHVDAQLARAATPRPALDISPPEVVVGVITPIARPDRTRSVLRARAKRRNPRGSAGGGVPEKGPFGRFSRICSSARRGTVAEGGIGEGAVT